MRKFNTQNPRRLRAQEAARHSMEAHSLLSLARDLRRAARTAYFTGEDDLGDSLIQHAKRLDARRRRLMKTPSENLL